MREETTVQGLRAPAAEVSLRVRGVSQLEEGARCRNESAPDGVDAGWSQRLVQL